MKMRPKGKVETLNQYALAASKELLRYAKKALKAKGVEGVWEVISTAICNEGQHVQVVSPAAVVIYQYYLLVAVEYLKEHPDDEKCEELVDRVRDDLAHIEVVYLGMRRPQFFTDDEYLEGKNAYEIIKKTFLSLQ